MSICRTCGFIGGWHKSWCPVPHAPVKYAPATDLLNSTRPTKAEER